ncbi:MAG: hypothetical protein O2899_02065, partial [Bacteroidetes bacterium]|nr:hypothetical protein [Bacteroidota bacterium]
MSASRPGGQPWLLILLPCLAVSMWWVVPAAAQDEAGRGVSFLPERTDTLLVVGPGPFLVRPFLSLPLLGLRINGKTVATEETLIEARDGLVTFPGIAPDSLLQVIIRYRYVPLSLTREWAAWPSAQDSLGDGRTLPPPDPMPHRLETRGSISRGVSAGTGRDARVESGLRLQVAGDIAPGIRLDAALTDEDTPLVPEGVTRQLDQFDRIRIGIEGKAGRVELGDYDALLDGTHHARLDRRLQGAGLTTRNMDSPIGVLQVKAGAAVSRGIFRSMVLPLQDGIQGPYRLTGAEGERFILIIPGTDRVYLDGERLAPGPDADYVLDVATAELTFTAR